MVSVLKPEKVEVWFPDSLRQRYVRHITGQRSLSPAQAEYFVRLWGYAYLKRKGPPYKKIQALDNDLYDYPFLFSHEEASRLFYVDKERGTSRAAGLMLKKFADDKRKNLIQYRRFEGTKTEITLNIPIEFALPNIRPEDSIYADKFDRRKDLLPVTKFLLELYSVNTQVSQPELEFSIKRGLRDWAQRYPKGMRVIRRSSDKEAIGFLTIIPVSPRSERQFCSSPHESLHLSRFAPDLEDPIQIASKVETDCYIAYIRSWQIQPGLWTYDNVLALLEETKITLRSIHEEYPELSEVYSMTIHPRLEEFARILGFKTSSLKSDSPIRWLFTHLDTFLSLDFQDVLSQFTYDD